MSLLVITIIFALELLFLRVYAKKVETAKMEMCWIRSIMTEHDLEVMRRKLRKQRKF